MLFANYKGHRRRFSSAQQGTLSAQWTAPPTPFSPLLQGPLRPAPHLPQSSPAPGGSEQTRKVPVSLQGDASWQTWAEPLWAGSPVASRGPHADRECGLPVPCSSLLERWTLAALTWSAEQRSFCSPLCWGQPLGPASLGGGALLSLADFRAMWGTGTAASCVFLSPPLP